MSRSILLLLLITVVCSVYVTADLRCGPNEEFRDCGTMCPHKCNEKPKKFCNQMCRSGCQCKQGYMLNLHNQCVLPRNC